jgi:soluble lytic murein transglycosylase-like protein
MIDTRILTLIIGLFGFGLGACAAPAEAVVPGDRSGIKRLVADEAMRLGVPVSLALAVAHAESNFDGRAHSRAGARGVMQVMPRTAWTEYGIEPRLLWNPRINVRLGLHFLGRLLRRYRGRVDLALSYYNGGSAVGDLPHARVIPATAAYVKRVRRLQRHYQRQLHTGAV